MIARRWLLTGGSLLVMVAAIAVATSPTALENQASLPRIPDNPADWIAQEVAGQSREAVVPGAEKRIRWFQGKENSRTEFAVVYLHGFSATRQELAPVPELLATKLLDVLCVWVGVKLPSASRATRRRILKNRPS